MKYARAQLITYVVKTDPPFAPRPGGVAPPATWALKEDAQVRAACMAGVIDHCRTTFASQLGGADTLKVFMAPEFYFRPPLGADVDPQTKTRPQRTIRQSANLYPELIAREIVGSLRAACQEPAYRDWLIVPGTVLMQDSTFVSAPTYFNRVYAFMGNRGPTWAIDKINFSWLDRLDAAYAAARKVPPPKIPAIGVVKQNPVITIGGDVSVGIEVCLDHFKRVLRTHLESTLKVTELATQGVWVQLLTSCGSDGFVSSIAARSDGCFFHCDGESGRIKLGTSFDAWRVRWRSAPPGAAQATPTQLTHLEAEFLPDELQIRGVPEDPASGDFVAVFPATTLGPITLGSMRPTFSPP